MASPLESLRKMQERPSLQLVLALGGAMVVLLLAAVVGLIKVSGSEDQELTTSATTIVEGDDLTPGDAVSGSDSTLAGGTDAGPSGTIDAGGKVPTTAKPSGTGPTTRVTTSSGAGSAAGDRTGVSKTTIRWGVHAPVTFDGAPLNLAEDPIEGIGVYIKYLNDTGGVNGRKIEYKISDDRYTVEGGKTAANDLVNDYKPFFVSGTLGVDQIYQVAAEARKRKVPYIAGGGSESSFKDIGMFQVSSSYDTHLIKLAEFLAKESAKTPAQSPYSGLKKVGVSSLDSPYIAPSVESFRKALASNGLSLVKVVKVQKPTEQTSYATQIQQLKDAGTEIFVPTQDPITTSRVVQECLSQRCQWKYAFSNFAHESDTALTLMGGTWTGVRGLAGGCYYIHPNEGDPAKCGQLKAAHEQWVKVNGEDDWVKDGQGGTAGYQLTHIWLKALKDAGTDPTREKFTAALLTYQGYADLVSGPITYKGSSNLSHGYETMVVYEGGGDQKWKQLTPGFVSSF